VKKLALRATPLSNSLPQGERGLFSNSSRYYCRDPVSFILKQVLTVNVRFQLVNGFELLGYRFLHQIADR